MNSTEIIAAYQKMIKKTERLLIESFGSGIAGILVHYLFAEKIKWMVIVQVALLIVLLYKAISLWFVFRCPRCGVFLGSRYRVQRKEGWQKFPPKSCWFCHMSFITGEELPHEKHKWHGVDI